MKPNVLVVDDEQLIRWSLGAALADAGYRVCELADGTTARAALKQGADVAVLDCRLPGVDGLTLLRESKADAPSRPVILMTAYRSPEITAEAERLGADAILDKPFPIQAMLRLVSRLLGGR